MNPKRVGDGDEGRIVQHRPIVEDDGRQSLRIHPMIAQQLLALVRVRGIESERDGIAGERLAQLVAVRRPGFADDTHDLMARAIRSRPRGECLLYLRVEQLLGSRPSLHDPEVDPSERGRTLKGFQRVEGNTGATPVHGDEQRTHGMPVHGTCLCQELDAIHPGQAQVGCHERHLFAALSQPLEGLKPGLGRTGRQHPIVGRETPEQS